MSLCTRAGVFCVNCAPFIVSDHEFSEPDRMRAEYYTVEQQEPIVMAYKVQTNRAAQRLTHMSIMAAFALLSSHAGAQDALGDGRALDASPSQYGRLNTERPSLVDELRFRNSIATGNAPGGLSFRGDLGYRAAGEFTGDLGSDSLFAFRRDSLYSGLAGMGIRGTDAIQYQFALTTGSTPPRNLMGNLSYTRDDLYNTGNQISRSGSTQSTTIGLDQQQLDIDPSGRALSSQTSITGLDRGSMMGTLRSSATYNTTSSLQPSLLSVYTQGIDNSPVGLVASPLLGITPTPMVDKRESPANPLVTRPSNADTDPNTPGGLPSTRVTTSYDELLQQMLDRAKTIQDEANEAGNPSSMQPGETNDQWLIRQMNDLRSKLFGNTQQGDQTDQQGNDQSPDDPNAPMNGTGSDQGNENSQGTQNGMQQSGVTTPLTSIPDASNSAVSQRIEQSSKLMTDAEDAKRTFEPYDPTQIAIDPDTLEVLRGNAATEITQLLDPNAQSRDLYSEHILAGERLIADSRYFDAEERFTHALSIKPRDVTAQLGRLHAQIGAGMLLSASVNLQSLFSDHPELITTKYAEGALLRDSRVKILKSILSERAGIVEPEIRTSPLEGDRVRVSAGLLLAYLGYQSEHAESVQLGLEKVRTLGTDSDRRFASLLEQLWIVPEQQDSTP